MPEIVVSLCCLAFFDVSGTFNKIIGALHIPGVDFIYGHPMMTIIIANVWHGTCLLYTSEIAVASCLACMKNFTESGTEFYSLREALQDTYLSFMLEQAIETEKIVKTEKQLWSSLES